MWSENKDEWIFVILEKTDMTILENLYFQKVISLYDIGTHFVLQLQRYIPHLM